MFALQTSCFSVCVWVPLSDSEEISSSSYHNCEVECSDTERFPSGFWQRIGLPELITRKRPSHHASGSRPAEAPPCSTLVIVTSSLPFQLGAQFHPGVPREPQPHHLRLESLNRHPPLTQQTHTIHTAGPGSPFSAVSRMWEGNVTERRIIGVNRLLDDPHVPYTEKCVDRRASQQCILGGAPMEMESVEVFGIFFFFFYEKERKQRRWHVCS